ncbi:hypothetical protein GCM10009566_52760 [Streptomyces murinus]
MWVDPDDDPRERGAVEGESATLRDCLVGYRMTLRMKCEGLDAEQMARRSVPPSTMSLLGLVRHLAEVEWEWRCWIGDEEPLPKLYGERDADFDQAVGEQREVDAAYAGAGAGRDRCRAGGAPGPRGAAGQGRHLGP